MKTDQRNRQRMLQNVRSFWIKGVLENSLHDAVLIELGLQHQAEQVSNPWKMKLRVKDVPNKILPHNIPISKVFDHYGGKLLILGNPGSGKTTTMLELTRELIKRAESDSQHPIPVVLNLSSWARERKSLEEWLIDELDTKYQVSRKVSKRWTAADDLLLLLDGLDEVKQPYRSDCIKAINAYRETHREVDMVVCSRSADYEVAAAKLALNTAIVIQPLDDTQIDAYLAQPGMEMETVRGMLGEDETLRELAQTPLTLSIMAWAYRGIEIEDLRLFPTVDEQRDHLFDVYVQSMFDRHPKSKALPPEKVMGYLSWLAGRMSERGQTVFHIEGLQADWLEPRWQQSVYKFASRLIYGLSVGAIAGGIIALALVLFIVVIRGHDLTVHPNKGDNIVGLNAWLFWILGGAMLGTLISGIAFGLSGLLAFAVDRLAIVKSKVRGYRIRNVLGITLLGGIAGAAFATLYALWWWWAAGEAVKIYLDSGFIEGLDALLYAMLYGGLTGVASGIAASVTALALRVISGGKQRFPLNRIVYGVYGGLLGIGSAIPYDLVNYPDFILPASLLALAVSGAMIGLVVGGFKDKIECAESLGWRWHWRWAGIGLSFATAIVALDYLFTGSRMYNPAVYRTVGLFIFLSAIGVLIGGIAGGLRKREGVETRTQPNEGIRRTVRSTIKVMLAFGLVGAVIGALMFVSVVLWNRFQGGTFNTLSEWDIQRILENLKVGLLLGGVGGLAVGLAMGGTDEIIKHLVLRLMLLRNRVVPFNYASFLDHAASLIFLRRVGGGFIFIHRYLLEYFARLEDEELSDDDETDIEEDYFDEIHGDGYVQKKARN